MSKRSLARHASLLVFSTGLAGYALQYFVA